MPPVGTLSQAILGRDGKYGSLVHCFSILGFWTISLPPSPQELISPLSIEDQKNVLVKQTRPWGKQTMSGPVFRA